MPSGIGPHPSVILVHGGAFLVGSRDMKPARFLATELVKAGFVVASMDYRMVLRGGRFKESQEDIETMTSWWFTQANTYNLDATNVAMLGISAGAALMLMAATKDADSRLSRLVSIYGLYDFENLGGGPLKLLRKKLFRSSDPATWRSHSPLHQFRGTQPVLLIHGTGDRIVPIDQAEEMTRQRTEDGLPVEFLNSQDSPHGFFNNASSPQSQEGLSQILEFLHGHPQGKD